MPQRLLRPGIRQSKRWARVGYFERVLYVALVTLVDDFGRYESDPELIRSEAFPFGDPNGDIIAVPTIDGAMLTLASKDLILLYEFEGKRYLQMTRWQERARSESKWPDPKNCVLLTFDSSCQQMIASPPQPKPQPSSSPKPAPEPSSPPRAPEFAETPSWKEFWAYCQSPACSLVAEWYARDKFLAAEAENWSKSRNWKAYANRCKNWWESDGRPMTNPKQGHPKENGIASTPFNLSKIIEAKVEQANGLKSRWAVETGLDTTWNSDKAKADYSTLKREIKDLKSRLSQLA